jgi:hypothetical protein
MSKPNDTTTRLLDMGVSSVMATDTSCKRLN